MLRLFLLLILFICVSTKEHWLEEKNAKYLHSREETLPVSRLSLTKPYGHLWTDWNVQGKVASTNNEIRLTPAVRGVSGAIWSKTSLAMKAFGIESDFRLASKDGLHADGAAIWFVDQATTGQAYGISSHFRGIGVVLDTFQNLDHGLRAFIGIIANDGSKEHSMHNNGKDVMMGKCEVAGMVKVDKGKLFSETISVYIEYLGNTIRVYHKYPGYEWTYCTDAQAHIPLNFLLGVSAATGELSSRHELIAMRTFEIMLAPEVVATLGPEELRFRESPSWDRPRYEPNWTQVFLILGFVIVAVVVILAAILYADYYYHGDDRIFT